MKSLGAIFGCFIGVLFLSTTLVDGAINSNGELGVVRTLSAKTMGKLTMNIGAGVNVSRGTNYIEGPFDNGVPLNGVLVANGTVYDTIKVRQAAQMLSSNFFLAFGILNFWDIAATLPFYYDWSGFSDNVNGGGIGDVEISTKITYPTPSKRLFFQSYYFAGTLPIGMKNNGLFPRHPYFLAEKDTNPAATFYSSEYPTFKGILLWTFDIGNVVQKVPLQIHLNLGGVINASVKEQNNTAIGALALEYSPTDFFTLFVDLNGESRWSNFSTRLDPSNDPMFLTPGFKVTTPGGVYLYLAGDFSLSSKSNSTRRLWVNKEYGGQKFSYTTGVIPDYGVQLAIGWNGFITTQDDDRDGLKNNDDRCPKEAEDIDNFEDSDGCPDYDNDADGLPDLKDKCPLEAEDKDGFRDDDGCPDLDNDGDGIPDLKDQCPNVAEDFDGFEDNDGCPDLDNDKDGIADAVDKCPMNAEDFDSFEDDDGCPDIDNDKDGIPDIRDKCPNEPETFNSLDDRDGCPDTVKKEIDYPKQQILNGVQFRNNTAEMTFDSYQFIDPLIRTMKQYTELEIEIRTHTDALGDFANNMRLTQMRAEAIRQYIISKDINSMRVRAVGMGSTVPFADNKTAAGRVQNRRIEIIRSK